MSAVATDNSKAKPHVMVFPYPAQGHMLPLLDLTHQLCLRDFAVSVIVTTGNLHLLAPLLSAHPSVVSAVTFPFPSHPSIPSGVENVQHLGNSGNLPIMAALHQLREPIILWFQSHPNPPVAVVSDFFLGWTNDLCRQIGIPRFAFFSSGAFLVSVIDFCFDNLDLIKSADLIHFSDLPRSPIFKEEHMPSTIRKCIRSSSPEFEIIRKNYIENGLSYGYIFNSSDYLEGEYFEHLKRRMGRDQVFGVGPLCLAGLDPSGRGKIRSGSCVDPDRKTLLGWLDGCPDRSVLYVCFGSQKVLTKDQCEALAIGLEKSMTRFVWVVKKDPVPDGFESRVKSRGLVVRGWAPQVELLGHVAVGGFLSHCGWNSVLEALTSQTMIFAWPMEADQFVNARLLVDHLGAAIRVCEGAETVPNPDELARVIADEMGENVRREIWERAIEIGREAIAAWKPGGSSSVSLDRLIRNIHALYDKSIS